VKTSGFKVHRFGAAAILAVTVMAGGVAAATVVQTYPCGKVTGTVIATLYDDGTFIVTGAGKMKDFNSSESDRPWEGNKTLITNIVIDDGVTSIGNWAFRHCTNLTSVTIGKDVALIGNQAFGYCTKLTSLTLLPASPPELGSGDNTFLGVPSNAVDVYVLYENRVEYSSNGPSEKPDWVKDVIKYIVTVTFDSQGGSAVPAQSLESNKKVTKPTPDPQKSGYEFKGWYKESACINLWDFTTSVTASIILYAKWDPITPTFTITFDANGGTVSPTSRTTNPDGTVSLPTPDKRKGYAYDGWFTAKTGGTAVTKNTTFDKNTTIYAQWIPITCTITFFHNDGTGSTTIRTTSEGGKVTPPTLTRDGYAFDGWFRTQTGGTEVNISNLEFNSDDRFYAHWSLKYTIEFDANGGTVSPTSGTTGAGGKLTSLPTPIYAGYTHKWFTEKTGGTEVKAGSDGTPFTSDATIYAQWTKAEYIIKYDPNKDKYGNVGKIRRNITVDMRDSYSTPRSDGWNGASLRISVNNTDLAARPTVPANSTSNKYTFDAYTGESVEFYWNPALVFNEECAFAVYYTDTPPPAGKEFKPESGSVNDVPPFLFRPKRYGELSTSSTSVGSFTVRRDSKFQPDTAEGGASVKLPSGDDLYNAGNTFAGWNTKSDGTGENYTAGSTFIPDTSVTLYARWKMETYTITFAVNGGMAVTPASALTGENWALATLPTPTHSNSSERFIGWYTTTNGHNNSWGTQVTPSYSFRESGNTTIYARWESTVSVLSEERAVPAVKPEGTAVVVEPAVVFAGEFTVGPNPVARQAGEVSFFRLGRRISGELRIYDAAGNAVNRVRITDNALGSQARRRVGSWDLRDAKGRLVSEGSYLVRGVVKTPDGGSEKVSVIVGVR